MRALALDLRDPGRTERRFRTVSEKSTEQGVERVAAGLAAPAIGEEPALVEHVEQRPGLGFARERLCQP